MNINVDSLLANAKARFDGIIYQLTQPGLPAGQRIGKLGITKTEVTKVLSEVANFKKQLTIEEEVKKVNIFLQECNRIYIEAVSYVTNDVTGDENVNPEYAGEMMKQAGSATIVPGALMDGKAKEAFLNQAQAFQAPQFAPMQPVAQAITAQPIPALTTEQMIGLSTLNFSNSLVIEDGEPISASQNTDLYYVVDPYTVDCQVRVVRFMSPDAVTQFVFDNFKNDNVQPLILYGRAASLQHNISLVL